ncbi:MAG: hypothetical protein ACYCO3_10745 [Mycobacteriales bacterium]
MTRTPWPYPSFTHPAWLGGQRSGDPALVGAIRVLHEVLREARVQLDNRPDSLLAALQAAGQISERLEWLLLSLVGEARANGSSWAQIGSSLGVSKQAAHARFAGLITEALRRAEERDPAR